MLSVSYRNLIHTIAIENNKRQRSNTPISSSPFTDFITALLKTIPQPNPESLAEDKRYFRSSIKLSFPPNFIEILVRDYNQMVAAYADRADEINFWRVDDSNPPNQNMFPFPDESDPNKIFMGHAFIPQTKERTVFERLYRYHSTSGNSNTRYQVDEFAQNEYLKLHPNSNWELLTKLFGAGQEIIAYFVDCQKNEGNFNLDTLERLLQSYQQYNLQLTTRMKTHKQAFRATTIKDDREENSISSSSSSSPRSCDSPDVDPKASDDENDPLKDFAVILKKYAKKATPPKTDVRKVLVPKEKSETPSSDSDSDTSMESFSEGSNDSVDDNYIKADDFCLTIHDPHYYPIHFSTLFDTFTPNQLMTLCLAELDKPNSLIIAAVISSTMLYNKLVRADRKVELDGRNDNPKEKIKKLRELKKNQNTFSAAIKEIIKTDSDHESILDSFITAHKHFKSMPANLQKVNQAAYRQAVNKCRFANIIEAKNLNFTSGELEGLRDNEEIANTFLLLNEKNLLTQPIFDALINQGIPLTKAINHLTKTYPQATYSLLDQNFANRADFLFDVANNRKIREVFAKNPDAALSPSCVEDIQKIYEFKRCQLANCEKEGHGDNYKKAINAFYENALAIRLDSKLTNQQQVTALRELAHKEFLFVERLPRLLADALMLISVLGIAIVGYSRIKNGQKFFLSQQHGVEDDITQCLDPSISSGEEDDKSIFNFSLSSASSAA